MIFLLLGTLFLSLLLHPFTTYPLSLRILRRLYPSGQILHGSAHRPSMSILVCAYNEGRVIADKVANLLEMRRAYGDLEILVYVDGATDNTAAELHCFRDDIITVMSSHREGKNRGMRRLASIATGSILVFTDANTKIDPASLAEMAKYFDSPAVGCVCGAVAYVNRMQSVTSMVNQRYWTLEERICGLESNLKAVMTASGAFFAVRKELYPVIPDGAADDFFVSMQLLCNGYQVVRASNAQGFEVGEVSRQEEFRRKVRIACKAFTTHRLLWSQIRQLEWLYLYCYVSHKLLRWFAGPNAAIACVFIVAGVVTTAGPIIALVALGTPTAVAVFGYLAHWAPARSAYEVCLAFAAISVGVFMSLRGQLFTTWIPSTHRETVM